MKLLHYVNFMLVLYGVVFLVDCTESLSISGFIIHDLFYVLDAKPPLVGALVRPRRNEVSTKDKPERLCSDNEAFHNETGKCYTILEKGPCGDLQLFYQTTQDSNYGQCACQLTNPDGCKRLHRMVLPGLTSENCFWANSQGPCQRGQWYVLNTSTLKPECQQNPCCRKQYSKSDNELLRKPSNDTDVFMYVKKDMCYRTFTRADCPEGQYAQFLGTNDPFPKCYKVSSGPPTCIFSIGTLPGLPCEPGTKLIGDQCTPIADFE